MARLSGHLAALEDEAVFIIREIVATRERPALLFSAGKDSIILLHLTRRAFLPAPLPVAVMHVDTGQNFPEVIAFRDAHLAALGVPLRVASVQASIDAGRAVELPGPRSSRNALQSVTLLDAIAEHRFDVAFGGARRDEDRARAKERVVSLRDELGQWDPKNQRPELWSLYNTRIRRGEHLRVFPISNFTEVDVWELHPSPIARRTVHLLLALAAGLRARWHALRGFTARDRGRGERVFSATVRFRTVGDMTCTGAVRSAARTVDEIIREVASATITERGATRADDRASEAAMEDRKREGYF